METSFTPNKNFKITTSNPSHHRFGMERKPEGIPTHEHTIENT